MANTLPFRLEVLVRLTALLGTISVAGGYFKDMPVASIFRGRIMYGESDPVPMLAIVEPPIPVELLPVPPGSSASIENWDLLIQGFIEDDPKHPTDPAHLYAADVRKVLALHKEDNQSRAKLGFGDRANTVEDIFIGQLKVRPADEISAKTYFWLPVSLKVHENLANPLEYRSA